MTFQSTMVRDWEEWQRHHLNATDAESIDAALRIWNEGFAACFAYCAGVRERIGEWTTEHPKP